MTGCNVFRPSHSRDWLPSQAVLPFAEFDGDRVTIHNIRNCTYRTADDYTVNYYHKTYDLNEVESVDFIVVPFPMVPGAAHTFLSFGFAGDDYLAVSVEARREKGEGYSPLKGLLNQYELMYVIGDERDLIQLRSNVWLEDVYVYRTRAPREKARALLVDMLERANHLAQHPEFYHLLTNNCTTNVMQHVNRIAPGRIPYGYEVLLPGYSDRLAHRLGLIADGQPFERTRLEARVNKRAYVYRDHPEFSKLIRR